MKICTSCKEGLPLDQFTYANKSKGYLSSRCKRCKKMYMDKWRENNQEHIKEYRRDQYQTSGKNKNRERYARYREQYKSRSKEYYHRNKDMALEKSRAYKTRNKHILNKKYREKYLENPEPVRARGKQWRQDNPERRSANEAKRRARLRGSRIGYADYKRIAERDRWICHICGDVVGREELSFDHLIPISLGGPHSEENIRVAHRVCNSRRKDGRIPAQLFLFTEGY